MEVNIHHLKEQVERILDCLDVEECRNYWGLKSVVTRKTWNWYKEKLEDAGEALGKGKVLEHLRVASLENLIKSHEHIEPPRYLELSGERIEVSNWRKVNEYLIPQHFFYLLGLGAGRDIILLLAELKEHKKENGVEKFVLGKELVSNRLPMEVSITNRGERAIIGRQEGAKGVTWNHILGYKLRAGEDVVAIWLPHPMESFFFLQGMKKFGIDERKVLEGELKELKGEVETISSKLVENGMARGMGYISTSTPSWINSLRRGFKLAHRYRDEGLHQWLEEMDVLLADVDEKGTYERILKQPDGEARFLLDLGSSDIWDGSWNSVMRAKIVAATSIYLQNEDFSQVIQAVEDLRNYLQDVKEEIEDVLRPLSFKKYEKLVKLKEECKRLCVKNYQEACSQLEKLLAENCPTHNSSSDTFHYVI